MAAAFTEPARAALREDLGYQRLLEHDSTFAHRYLMAQPTPSTKPPAPQRLTVERWPDNVHVGAAQVDDWNGLMLGTHTRVHMRAAHNRPQTELFSTAPYVALGRGTLRNIDASNAMHYPVPSSTRRSTVQPSEIPMTRLDFVDIVPVVSSQRTGKMTRVGPAYVRAGTA